MMITSKTFETVFAAVLAAGLTLYATSLWLPTAANAGYDVAFVVSKSLKSLGTTALTGAVTMASTLNVTGAATFTSTASVEGNTSLGNATTDTTTITGKLIQTTNNTSTSTLVSSALARDASIAQHYIWRFDDAGSTSTNTTGEFTCDADVTADDSCTDVKNFGMYIAVQHPTANEMVGDSRDAAFKVSYSNFGDNSSTEFKARGIEMNVANRAGGDLLELAGIDLVVQGIDGSNTSEADYLIGMRTAIESSIDQGSPVEMAGQIVELKGSVAKPTNQYGFVSDNKGSYADAADAAYFIRDSGTNTGFGYGFDCGSASIVNAAVRLNNSAVIMTGSGAPTSGASGTGDNFAGPGSLYLRIDGASGSMLYTQTGAITSPTWVNVE